MTSSSSEPTGRTPSVPAIICLSSQDWDVPLQTNRQRISAEAARRGHDVLFVENGSWVGTYLLSGAVPLQRRLRRLVSTDVLDNRVRIHHAFNPLPMSWRYKFATRINAAFEARTIRRLARRLGLAGYITLVYDPRAIEIA